MVSVLARRPREEGAHVLAAINTLVGAGLIGVTRGAGGWRLIP
jgi:putative peptidoglycan lipid II flippase